MHKKISCIRKEVEPAVAYITKRSLVPHAAGDAYLIACFFYFHFHLHLFIVVFPAPHEKEAIMYKAFIKPHIHIFLIS